VLMTYHLSYQASEASKMYAEEKDEEVKILEHSVEELEGTINVLESKVSLSTLIFCLRVKSAHY